MKSGVVRGGVSAPLRTRCFALGLSFVHLRRSSRGLRTFIVFFTEDRLLPWLAFCGPQQLATAGSDNQIHLWDVATKEEIGSLRGHTGHRLIVLLTLEKDLAPEWEGLLQPTGSTDLVRAAFDPARVVAPTNVNFGNSSLIERAPGP